MLKKWYQEKKVDTLKNVDGFIVCWPQMGLLHWSLNGKYQLTHWRIDAGQPWRIDSFGALTALTHDSFDALTALTNWRIDAGQRWRIDAWHLWRMTALTHWRGTAFKWPPSERHEWWPVILYSTQHRSSRIYIYSILVKPRVCTVLNICILSKASSWKALTGG